MRLPNTIPTHGERNLGAIANLVRQLADLLRTFLSLTGLDLVRLLFLLVAALFAILFIVYQKPIQEGWNTFRQCTLYPIVGGLVFSGINLFDLAIATVIPLWNFFWTLVFSTLGLSFRVLLHCTLAGSWTALSNFVVAFARGLEATVLSISIWLQEGDMLHARINFAPGLTVLLSSFQQLVTLFDCYCQYLNFFWVDLFSLPASPSLITAIDCGLNIAVRALQILPQAIDVPQVRHLFFSPWGRCLCVRCPSFDH